MNAIISVTFKGGLGNVTAKAFSNGAMTANGAANSSGTIMLSNLNSGDVISVNGVSPDEGTDISIDVNTSPPTPSRFSAGPILAQYDVL